MPETMHQPLLGFKGVARIGPVNLILCPALVVEGILVGSMLQGPVDNVFVAQPQAKQQNQPCHAKRDG